MLVCGADTLNLYNDGEPLLWGDRYDDYSEARETFTCRISRIEGSVDEALTSDMVLVFTRTDESLWNLGPLELRFEIEPL